MTRLSVVLSSRLQAVADFVPINAAVVDVGTDHALLPIYLIQSGRASLAVASDVVSGPYRAAQDNVRKFGCLGQIAVRLADGLTGVHPGEVNTALIAGMGGQTAVDILSASPEVVKRLNRLVLQPMNAQRKVRLFLREAGFGLVGEKLVVEDGRFYTVIAADRSVPVETSYLDWSASDLPYCLEYGPLLLQQQDRHVCEYLQRERDHTLRILDEIHQNGVRVLERVIELESRANWLTSWLRRQRGCCDE